METDIRQSLNPSALRPKRPVSRRGARRIESEYGRRNKLIDPMNVRWRADNVVVLDMEMPERRTKDFEYGGGGAMGMNYWLERVGSATEDDVEIAFENEVEVAPSSSLLAASASSREKDKSATAASGPEKSSVSGSSSSSGASGPVASATSAASASKKATAAAASETAGAVASGGGETVRDKSSSISSKKASSKRPPTAR